MWLPAMLAVTLASTAQAYVVRKDSKGEPVRWMRTAEFVVDARLEEKLRAVGAMAATERAVKSFAMEGIDISLRQGAVGGLGFDATPGATNRSEIVVPDEWLFDESAIAITIVTADARTHQILDADIAFNARHREFAVLEESSGPGAGAQWDDVQNTLTHELGHALGLAHNPEDVDVVMYPSAARGEIQKRFLSEDDHAGLSFLYDLPPRGTFQGGEDAAMGCSTSSATGAVAWMALAPLLLFFRRRSPR